MTEANPQIKIYQRRVIEEHEVSRILDIGYLIIEYQKFTIKYPGREVSN